MKVLDLHAARDLLRITLGEYRIPVLYLHNRVAPDTFRNPEIGCLPHDSLFYVRLTLSRCSWDGPYSAAAI